jgi:hypothetical protein
MLSEDVHGHLSQPQAPFYAMKYAAKQAITADVVILLWPCNRSPLSLNLILAAYCFVVPSQRAQEVAQDWHVQRFFVLLGDLSAPCFYNPHNISKCSRFTTHDRSQCSQVRYLQILKYCLRCAIWLIKLF